MAHLMVFILGVVFAMTAAAENRDFCGMTFKSSLAAAGDALLSINIGDHHMTRTDLIEFTLSGAETNLIRSTVTGYPFVKSSVATSSTFCSNGHLYIADMNGDGHDDLLCQASTGGVLSYRNYISQNNFAAEKTLDGFICSANVLIGDFDGNHVDDIMCYDSSLDVIGSESSIYFSGHCATYHHHGPSSFHRIPHHDHLHSPYNCMASVYTFPDNAISGCDQSTSMDYFIVADVFGDGEDDLVCHHANDDVSYYRATGHRSGTVFGPQVQAGLAALTCTHAANRIIALDVDGDKDEDLVCVNGKANAAANQFDISVFNNGAFESFQMSSAPTSCIDMVCRDGATDIAVLYQTGDFNGDGKEDYLCHWSDTNEFFEIAYSVPVLQ